MNNIRIELGFYPKSLDLFPYVNIDIDDNIIGNYVDISIGWFWLELTISI